MILSSFLAFLFAPAFSPEAKPEAKPAPKKLTPDLPGMIAWLETQDPATTYDSWSTEDCLICRFVGAVQGKSTPVPFYLALRAISRSERKLSQAAYGRENPTGFGNPTGSRGGHTYGGALARARALQ